MIFVKSEQENFRVIGINRHRMYIDGEGINTLVGLYGCPLNCKYCLNKKELAQSIYQQISPKDLVQKVLIDYCYFKATGGGVTFGGGEPLLQSGEIKAFREMLPKDIPVRVETSLNVVSGKLKDVLDVVDTYIIDIKTMNSKLYADYTGVDNKLVLENLQLICEKEMQDKCKIRIPQIPDFVDKEELEENIKIVNGMGFNNIDVFDYVIR